MDIDGLKDSFQYGMHGCGYYKGTNHTNSLEALKYWRKQGVKVMEIDIAKTCDCKFVALAHLMDRHYLNLVEIEIPDNCEELTEEWFLSQKLCNRTTDGLTTMNLSMIVDLMRKDTELLIMFDLWRMWKSEDTCLFSKELLGLTENVDCLSRCVVEVYNRDMIDGIKKASEELKIMYCVHAPKEPEFDGNVTPSILKELGIGIISYPWNYVKQYPSELEEYKQKGFIVFSLFRDNRYSAQMKAAGVNVNLLDIQYNLHNTFYVCYQRFTSKLKTLFRKIRVTK